MPVTPLVSSSCVDRSGSLALQQLECAAKWHRPGVLHVMTPGPPTRFTRSHRLSIQPHSVELMHALHSKLGNYDRTHRRSCAHEFTADAGLFCCEYGPTAPECTLDSSGGVPSVALREESDAVGGRKGSSGAAPFAVGTALNLVHETVAGQEIYAWAYHHDADATCVSMSYKTVTKGSLPMS